MSNIGVFRRFIGRLGPLQLAILALVLCFYSVTVLYLFLYLLKRILSAYVFQRNHVRRRALLARLGIYEHQTSPRRTVIGFFHPYCNAGGGGERVLWTAVACMQRTYPDTVSVVYSGDVDATKEEVLAKVKTRFSIDLDPQTLTFVFLRRRRWVQDDAWPRFTLLGQALGSMWLVLEALSAIVPDVYIDTMGYPFTFPLVKALADIPVSGYVHYPTISADMIRRVQHRISGHTNTSGVASSRIRTQFKLAYYFLFSELYASCLRKADHLMVNSTWTQRHIQRLLTPPFRRDEYDEHLASNTATSSRWRAEIVYPPCDASALSKLPLEGRQDVVLSVAQFRPEKEHAQQLRAFHRFISGRPPTDRTRLVMAGSVRGEADERRVAELKQLASSLGIQDKVEFVINCTFPELLNLFGTSMIGLSTMVDEHFGINVVEFMAAGLVPVVHASGGPLLDIVVPFKGQMSGFHALSEEDFAAKIDHVLCMDPDQRLDLQRRARDLATDRFSTESFETGWLRGCELISKSPAS